MIIKKIINNNIVSTNDINGRELIVSGKGIGFGKKPGDPIDKADVRKIYRMTSSDLQRRLIELLDEMPYEHLKLADELVEDITEHVPHKLNEGLILTLADHVSFAIRRKENGLEFSNTLLDAIMTYYPEEYEEGVRCLGIIKDRLGVELKLDEAGFIAMHIVNAELNTKMDEMYEITEFIEECVKVVEYYYDRQVDRKSLAFSRFIIHLRYFAQRLFAGAVLETNNEAGDETFRRLIKQTCRTHYKCAECIAEFIKNKYDRDVTEEELIYLTIHLKRINLRSD